MNRSILATAFVGVLSLQTLAAAPPPIVATAYRPDGAWLAAGHGRKVTFIHHEGKTTEVSLPARVTALAWSPDGRLLAVAFGQPGKSGSIHIHTVGDDGQINSKVGPIAAHDDLIHALAFSPDGNTLASCSYDRLGKLWSVADGSLVRPLKDHSDAVYAITWSPDGRRLATAAADRTVKLWDAATGQRLVSLNDPTDWVYAAAWSPDGRYLAAAGVDRSIRIWDVGTAEPQLARSAFAHEKAIIQLLFSQDGSILFSLSEDRTVKAWNSGTLTEKRVYAGQPEAVLSLSVRPDGKHLALGRYDGALIVLDRESGQMIAQPLPAKPKPPKLARIEPDHIVRGGRQTIVIRGEHLSRDLELLTSSANVKFAKAPSDGESLGEVRFQVEAASSVEPGVISIRVKTAGGESNAVPFYVDRFTAVAEPPGTEIPRSAPPVTTDTTIVGGLSRAGEVDHYRLRLDAGQEVGVQVQPISGSKLEAVLACIDTTGRRAAVGSRGALGFVAPSAGEYTLIVHDREYRGGADYGYRLHVGRIPIVTSVTPLGIGRGETAKVEVRGVFLDGERTRTVQAPPDAAVGSRIPVPVDSSLGPVLQTPSLVVGEFPHVAPGQAIPIPGSGQGVIDQPGASQEWTFTAKQGDAVIVEVEARRLGSDLDSMIEVLDAHGHPVEQAVLRSVARTFVTFRDHDSTSPGIRMEAWNEFAIDDYVWVGQELMRIRALPRNPDDDCQFYAVDGQRVGYLGTTPTHHAFNTPMYKVMVHPPGSKFPPNGMPLVTLTYRNDDGGPGYGKDSRLRFTAPVDGEYRVRITDARGLGGPTYGYRLSIRPPRPDYRIRFAPTAPAVWRGGSVPITVTASRIDDFDGPIQVRLENLPPGFSAPATFIEAGQQSTTFALYAEANAPTPPADHPPLKLVATARIHDQDVVREATGDRPSVQDPGDLITTTAQNVVTIRPGQETRLLVRVERRNGFTGRVPLDVLGLPHGVRVLHVGLNGILITERDQEREIFLYAEPWVQPMEHPFIVLSRREGKNTEHGAPSVLLKVEK